MLLQIPLLLTCCLCRPSYSQEALNHVLAAVWADGNASPKACLDVAAGTGKFTRHVPRPCGAYLMLQPAQTLCVTFFACRLLAEHPMLAVEAVEPNDAMRQGFEAAQKGWNITRPIRCQAGSATSLPFEDASFDLVSVAQVAMLSGACRPTAALLLQLTVLA